MYYCSVCIYIQVCALYVLQYIILRTRDVVGGEQQCVLCITVWHEFVLFVSGDRREIEMLCASVSPK